MLKKNNIAVLTDNKQARKAARIYGLKLIGSPEVVVSLHKAKVLQSEKALAALDILRKFGWFDDYLIKTSMEERKNE